MLTTIRLPFYTIKRIRSCCLTVAVLLIVAMIGGCLSLVFLAGRSSAASPPNTDVVLIIDHSQSMWTSDPNLLRLQAAELFFNLLGVDQETSYRVGVVTYGTDPYLVSPPVTLADSTVRRRLTAALANPQPMGWTDTNRALEMAAEQFDSGTPDGATPTIILLTDGRPETEATQSSPQAQTAYNQALIEILQRLSDAGIRIYVVLLDVDGVGAARVWRDGAGTMKHVTLHHVRTPDDLAPVYHEIAVGMQPERISSTVVETSVQGRSVHTATVEPALARVTFVVHKYDPDLTMRVTRPDGHELTPSAPGIQMVAGEQYEIWSVAAPVAGEWRLELDGEGRVTVWKDARPLPPTPTPTATKTPMPTTTPVPTRTLAPTATATQDTVTMALARDGKTPTDPQPPDEPTGPKVLLAVLAAGILLGSAWIGWVRLSRRAPPLDGTLRLVEAPGRYSMLLCRQNRPRPRACMQRIYRRLIVRICRRCTTSTRRM